IASGLDPARSILFNQSQVAEHSQLAWVFNCVARMGWMQRMTQFKDKAGKNAQNASLGLFAYPALMAADILAYHATHVPVGEDQIQHIEITRDLAQKFNNAYGEVFKLPAHRIRADAGVLPGIDGEKMSKSYGNTIDPFLPEKKLRKLINKVVTDSTPMEDAKVPENCTVYKIFKALAGSDDQRTQDLADQYRAGGMGYGHAKKALADLILDHFGPARKLREELMADPAYVQQVLADGAAAAQAKVAAVTDRVRKAVGL
ncbi:MAG TPA: tryptophan--tRNA ligase, partial [Phycisphaerales bacterium]|nr:tryptophan--tRNA ligase [Phycisphaerales bacterium]